MQYPLMIYFIKINAKNIDFYIYLELILKCHRVMCFSSNIKSTLKWKKQF